MPHVETFGNVGLELNGAKSKVLKNDNITFSFLDIADNLVSVIEVGALHKHLGRGGSKSSHPVRLA